MHDLKRERDEETASLEKMVQALDKIAKGEERASFFQQKMIGKIEEQMKSQGADEKGLQQVRSSMK